MESQKGRCMSCGLLAKRIAPHVPPNGYLNVYFEVRPEARVHGELFGFPNSPLMQCEPVCYAGAYPLAHEIMGPIERPDSQMWSQKRTQWQQNCVDALAKDRRCQSWVEYVEGLDPRWHLESDQMSRLEEDRRTWEKNFHVEMEDKKREWEERFRRQDSRLNIKLTLLAVAIAIVVGAITLTCDSLLLRIIPSLSRAASCVKVISIPPPESELYTPPTK